MYNGKTAQVNYTNIYWWASNYGYFVHGHSCLYKTFVKTFCTSMLTSFFQDFQHFTWKYKYCKARIMLPWLQIGKVIPYNGNIWLGANFCDILRILWSQKLNTCTYIWIAISTLQHFKLVGKEQCLKPNHSIVLPQS